MKTWKVVLAMIVWVHGTISFRAVASSLLEWPGTEKTRSATNQRYKVIIARDLLDPLGILDIQVFIDGMTKDGKFLAQTYGRLSHIPDHHFGGALLSRDGKLDRLKEISGDDSEASWPLAVSSTGIVVGRSKKPGDRTPNGIPVIWKGGNAMPLHHLRGQARGVNRDERVIGFAYRSHPDDQRIETLMGFVWKSGIVETLEPLKDFKLSYASSISDEGWIVGDSYQWRPDAYYETFATLWKSSDPKDPIKLPLLAGAVSSAATAINSNDVIVGTMKFENPLRYCGARWTRSQDGSWEVECLPTLPQVYFGLEALGMNDQGDIVGGTPGSGNETPVLWRNGGVSDINDLIEAPCKLQRLDYVRGIHESGIMWGRGRMKLPPHVMVDVILVPL